MKHTVYIYVLIWENLLKLYILLLSESVCLFFLIYLFFQRQFIKRHNIAYILNWT